MEISKLVSAFSPEENQCAVSVVIPSFNSAKFLPGLFDYLLTQPLQDIEVIVADDGSTDNTREVVEGRMEKDARVHYCYQTNSGAGIARNLGLSNARGKYVICLDADDLYEVNMLEKLYQTAEKFSAEVVICNFRREDFWLHETVPDLGFRDLPVNQVFCMRDQLRANPRSIYADRPSNNLYLRKKVLENGVGYSGTRAGNDLFFTHVQMLSADRIVCIPDNLLTVRRFLSDHSITSTRLAHLDDTVRALEQLFDWHETHFQNDSAVTENLIRRSCFSLSYNSNFGYSEAYIDEIRRMFSREIWRKQKAERIRFMIGIDFRTVRAKMDEVTDRLPTLDGDEKKAAENQLLMLKGKYANYCWINALTDELMDRKIRFADVTAVRRASGKVIKPLVKVKHALMGKHGS